MRHAPIGLALLALAGCGSGDDEPSDTPKPPAKKVNHEPRVEGHWRIVYTPTFGGGQEQRATWTVTPECSEGPCDFRIKSSAGARHHFRYDPAIKDWTGRDRQRQDCVEDNSDEVTVKGGYRVRSQITLTPIRAVRNAKGTFVTEMFGDRRDRISVTPEAQEAGCALVESEQEGVRAVRIDPPAGNEQTVGPKVEEGVE